MGYDVWWLWMGLGLVLGIIEVAAPFFLFLGFAIGAILIGFLLLIGGGASAWFAGSFGLTLVLFAVLSLLSWFAMRQLVGLRRGQRKSFDHDINEN